MRARPRVLPELSHLAQHRDSRSVSVDLREPGTAAAIDDGLALYASLSTTVPPGACNTSMRHGAGRTDSKPLITSATGTCRCNATAAA